MLVVAAALVAMSFQADAAEQSWRVSASPQGQVLSDGVPENATIRIVCVSRGQLRAHLSGLYTGEGPEPRSVVVQSGRARTSLRLAYGEEGFSADIPANAPVMQAFERSGQVAFRAAGGELAQSGGVQTVAGFLRSCRG